MGVITPFNYAAWAQLFPEFCNLTEAQVTGVILPLAEQYCRNDGGGPVRTPSSQVNLLNLIVAHCAQLLYGSTIQPLSPIVGRVNSAGEGSVNVGAEWPGANADSAWFLQTRYGAMFWQACAPYRTMRYIPGYPRQSVYGRGPWGYGRRGF